MAFKFHHVHLICSDLEKTIAFFTEALGAELMERKKFGPSDGATLDLNGAGIFLRVARESDNLLADTSVHAYGYNHIGLEVENLEAVYRHLSGKGHAFSVAPTVAGGRRIAFLTGPDNISIELLEA